jgi:hypothetical protein
VTRGALTWPGVAAGVLAASLPLAVGREPAAVGLAVAAVLVITAAALRPQPVAALLAVWVVAGEWAAVPTPRGASVALDVAGALLCYVCLASVRGVGDRPPLWSAAQWPVFATGVAASALVLLVALAGPVGGGYGAAALALLGIVAAGLLLFGSARTGSG